MIIPRALYELKPYGVAFEYYLLRFYGFWDTYLRRKIYIYLGSAIKSDGTAYWEYVLYYVDNVLFVSANPEDI